MATVTPINRPRGQTRSGVAAVLSYVMQRHKAEYNGRYLVTGVNCQVETCCTEFISTKLQYRKCDGKMYFHFVQSFHPEEDITPEEAHAVALELAQQWKDYEVIVATHTDAAHIHSHLVINSVSFQNGKKLHFEKEDLTHIRAVSDALCRQHGLSVCQKTEHPTSGIRQAEYHTAMRGESWKFQVINTIDLCMCRSRTKKEFIENMKQLGYGVRWENGRKNITYTHPCGKKVRDEKLHNRKYLKARMEHEFRIREEIISGRIEEAQYAAGTSPDAYADAADYYREYDAGGVRQSVNSDAGVDPLQAGFDAVEPRYEGVGGRCAEADAERGTASDDDRTGWEGERAEAFSETQTTSAEMGWADGCGAVDGYSRSAVDSVVRLGRQLEQSQYAAPMNDGTMRPAHIDRKRWKKLQEKRIANGHKEDDHEEEQTWQQTMF